MVDPRSSRFWQAALRSGLATDEAMAACWDAVPLDKRQSAEAIDRRLARQAVNAGVLTLWQAQQVLAGKTTGFRIDKYLLLEKIGQGGMGRVYLAKDIRLNRRVALKVLSPERSGNPRAVARFRREAKVGAQLQHENLIRIYDEGEANGAPYLVMEYIEGQNLAQRIAASGPMPPGIAAGLARQVALGLDHAHRKGLIHRDVNPANILLTVDGLAKLTDLGLAIDLADEEEAVTRDGATVGTFDYVSPEQARHSRTVDARSDVYSLGCTLYHLIAGRVPFPMASLPEKLFAHQSRDPDSLLGLVPDVPPGLDAVVRRMMRKDPADRYPNLMELAEALAPFASVPAQPADGSSASEPIVATTAAVAAVAAEALGSGEPDAGPVGRREDLSGEIASLNFGPAVPIGHGLTTASGLGSGVRPARGRLVRALALVAAVLGLAALAWSFASTFTPGPTPVPAAVHPTDPPGPVAPKPGPEPADSGVAVHIEGEGIRRVAGLREAIEIASSRGGQIVLSNRAPLAIRGDETIRVHKSPKIQQSLTIQAAAGVRPVLEISFARGPGPWLLSDRNAPLTLRGLTVEARFAPSGEAPTVVHALGDLTLDRCSFRSSGGRADGGQAVVAEGRSAAVDGCWFDGFDPAIELAASPGSHATIAGSMIVRVPAGPEGPTGRAIRVNTFSTEPAGRPGLIGPSLAVRRCTVLAGTLIELAGAPGRDPLGVEVAANAVRSRSLVRWGSPPDARRVKGVTWTGKGNLFDLPEGGWVDPPASAMDTGPDMARSAIVDLAALCAGTGDRRAFKFAEEPATATPGEINPAGFALDPGAGRTGLGADPAKVGPP